MSRVLALLLAGLVTACSGGGGGGDDDPGGNQAPPANPNPPAPNPPPPTTTGSAIVPNNATPPVAVTFEIGFTENVTRAQMQSLFATFVSANSAIWNVSEGQVRIAEIRFRDNVAPGLGAQQFILTNGAGVTTNQIDILVWPAPQWDIPFSGAVGEQPGQGREGRLMVIPENVRTFVLMHECSHLLFRLSWAVGTVLVDEYVDGVQDVACIMESENRPWRWCSDVNHTSQPQAQPHSCWRQLLADYPNFRHNGSEMAPNLPPAPTATYNE